MYDLTLTDQFGKVLKCRIVRSKVERRSKLAIHEIEYEGAKPGPWVYESELLKYPQNILPKM